MTDTARVKALRQLDKRGKGLLLTVAFPYREAFLERFGSGNMPKLLGSNPKVVKGEGQGYATSIMHLAPAKLSGFNTCTSATPGCRAACLNTSGQGGMIKGSGQVSGCALVEAIAAGRMTNKVQAARIIRTIWYFVAKDSFMFQLEREIRLALRRADAANLVPVFRLNGTSDLRWEAVRMQAWGGGSIFDRFPGVQFYDYTKHSNRKGIPSNYHLTFSLAESNDGEAVAAMRAGLNVAVVLRVKKGEPMPDTWHGRLVFDADTTDLRFLDPKGVILGLRAKGHGRRDASGFVRDAWGNNYATLKGAAS